MRLLPWEQLINMKKPFTREDRLFVASVLALGIVVGASISGVVYLIFG